MNHIEFEKKMSAIPTEIAQFDRRKEARTILREVLCQDDVVCSIYRDKEDLMDCTLEVIFIQLDNCNYFWFDHLAVGCIWRFSQLERINSEYSSTVLFTTDEELGTVGCKLLEVTQHMYLVL